MTKKKTSTAASSVPEASQSPLEALAIRYRILGPPQESVIAGELLPLLARFIKAIRMFGRQTDRGHELVEVAGTIALSEQWEVVAEKFGAWFVHLTAAHSAQVVEQPHAYFTHIGRGGMPPHIIAALNKVNFALVRPVDRHNEEVGRLGHTGPRYRLGDVIEAASFQDLESAERILTHLVEESSKTLPVQTERRGGRPPSSDPHVDERVAAAWRSGRWKTKAALDRDLGQPLGFTNAAVERHASRRSRRGSDKPSSRP